MFWFSTFFDIGNGGVLLQPDKDYDKTQDKIRSGEINFNELSTTTTATSETDNEK